MYGKFITAADTIYTLAIDGIFPMGFTLEGFSADDVFSTTPQELAEGRMGTDGNYAVGFVHAPIEQTITLEANSPSIDKFQIALNYSQATRVPLIVTATIIQPALKKKYTGTKGVIHHIGIPDAKRTLQPVQIQITWERFVPEGN